MAIKCNILFCVLFLSTYLHAQETKKLYTGFSAGLQHSSFSVRSADASLSNGVAFRAAYLLDFEVTRRLSIQTQLGTQFINAGSFTGMGKHTLIYPELWLGMNEYLPIGSGALFINLSLNAGYGVSAGGTDPFKDSDYKRFRAGWGILIGYILPNGIFFNTGAQNSFTDYYNNGFRAHDVTLHIISIGYLTRFKERNKARRIR